MKKILAALAAGFVALACLAGCASTGPQTPAQVLANVQAQVTKACAIANPTILSLQAMSAQMSADQLVELGKASMVVTAVCASPTPQIANVQDFINVAVPAAIKVIAASPMKDADKTTAEIALTAASVAVSAALAEYAVPAAPASGAVAS